MSKLLNGIKKLPKLEHPADDQVLELLLKSWQKRDEEAARPKFSLEPRDGWQQMKWASMQYQFDQAFTAAEQLEVGQFTQKQWDALVRQAEDGLPLTAKEASMMSTSTGLPVIGMDVALPLRR